MYYVQFKLVAVVIIWLDVTIQCTHMVSSSFIENFCKILVVKSLQNLPLEAVLKSRCFWACLEECLWRSSFFSTVAGFRLKDGLLLTLASIVTIALTLFSCVYVQIKPQSEQINVQVKNKDISTVLMTGLKCTEDTRTNSVTSLKCC